MKPKIPRLSHRDIEILSMLADGVSYSEIESYFGLLPSALHAACYYLRKKTGIQQTRDAAECKIFFKRYSQLAPQRVADALNPARPKPKDVTFCQLEVFRLIALGRSYEQIAGSMGITAQAVQNLASRGAQRAGIVHAGWNRNKLIKEWIERHDGKIPRQPARPMDDPAF